VNVASYPPPPVAEEPSTPPAEDLNMGAVCPLCGGALDPAQDWCLRCGAAARTRLAASPNWRAPLLALALVALLALGVLAAALVKLAGDTGSSARTITSSVAAPAAATSTPAPPAAASSAPAAITPSPSTTPPPASAAPTTQAPAKSPAGALGTGPQGKAAAPANTQGSSARRAGTPTGRPGG
jgi:hypothetical protein